MLLGFYYLYTKNSKSLAIAFFIFGVSSHFSLVLFVPFYFLLKINNNFFRRIVNLVLVVLVGYTLLTSIIFNLLSGYRFIDYLTGDLVSSYSGGIFSFAPLIPIYLLCNYYYKERIKLDPSLESDLKFSFLFKMSLIPAVFIGIALTAQVIGHRYIMTGMLFPILLFFYKFNEITDKLKKVQFSIVFFILYIFVFIHFNFSSGIFLGEWEMVGEMRKMLRSNEIIKYLIY